MVNNFTPGSFTKNFGNGDSFEKLQAVVSQGFQHALIPTSRAEWRKNAGIADRDRQLLPLNFFLYSKKCESGDVVMLDRFVEQAMAEPYGTAFERLALFTLHLSNSGTWKGSRWPDGRVAGWCNEFIRTVVWQNSRWQRNAFSDASIAKFLDSHVRALPGTKVKIRTNYVYFLELAGITAGEGSADLQPETWGQNACWVFWDRLMYHGDLKSNPTGGELLAAFRNQELYKLLGCGENAGFEIAISAAADYVKAGAINRFTH